MHSHTVKSFAVIKLARLLRVQGHVSNLFIVSESLTNL
jgi:hypothetical protein